MYAQYGCGLCAPQTWINFDASPSLRVQSVPLLGKLYTRNRERFPANVKFSDVTKRLPLADESCDGVFCSHVLEHLAAEDFDRALRETFRILKCGGIFRFVVPDLEQYALRYLDEVCKGDPSASASFMRQTCLGVERRPRTLTAFVSEWLGNSRHLWMWDYASLKEALRKHGFHDIRRARFNDCEDERFHEVEQQDRFEDACAVQAVRPIPL